MLKPEHQDTSEEISSRVYDRQVEILYERQPFAVISTAFLLLLTYIFLTFSYSALLLAAWFVPFYLILGFRAYTCAWYSRRGKRDTRKAERIYIIGILATGLAWGCLSTGLLPQIDLKGQILLIIVIMGLAASLSITIGYRRLPMIIYLCLLILPLALAVSISSFPNAIAITIAMPVYLAYLLKSTGLFYEGYSSMLRLQELARIQEKTLLDQREEAELANEAKSEFLSRMSHELRTPLNAVLGMNELQLRDSKAPLSEVQRIRALKIRDAGHHLLSLVNDVLDFTRIESGGIEINIQPVNLVDVLHESLKLVEANIRKRGLRLYYDDPQPTVWVMADHKRLKQVLLNLLDNAVKYNRKGGMISIKLESPDGRSWRVSVIDTGYGIPVSSTQDIFKPFSRIDAEKLGVEGSGIGLSFSKHLMEMMNGEIGVESRRGEGSCFWIEIPSAATAEPGMKNSPVVSEYSAFDEPGDFIPSGCRLLLAEDNKINQEVVIDMLEQMGCDVDVVENGSEAIDKMSVHSYDLVLMDCEMPILDGLQATLQIRESERDGKKPEIPVIALTAHAIEGAREKCLDHGMNDFLSKPFTFSDLQAMVSKWVNQTPAPDRIHESTALGDSTDDILCSPVHTDAEQAENRGVAEEVLSHEALDQLRISRKNRPVSLVKRVVSLYLEEAPGVIGEIFDAARSSDTDRITHLAHKLKSSSMTVGATGFADVCRQIEVLGEEGIIEQALLARLRSQYQAVETALERVLEAEA